MSRPCQPSPRRNKMARPAMYGLLAARVGVLYLQGGTGAVVRAPVGRGMAGATGGLGCRGVAHVGRWREG